MDKNSTVSYPPMGWNSWDCYGASVTEQELRQNMDYLADNMLEYGWEYVVCDIQWYEPTADSSHYHVFADLCMDEFGRLIPAPNRFPSAADGKGFGPIAEYAHKKGLKFGIHIMRGIPRQAVARNTPVKGTQYTARQVAHPLSVCCWNSDMYGLDPVRPGAQEYYDSIIELYASWGVDFIKVDDICVKYGRINDESTLQYGGDEIEMLHRAIARCGRPIVLSLSPGPAMLSQAEHLRRYANMWRITNDLWDTWPNIMEMFERCNEWSPYVSQGCYPDCDMLPFGHISIRGCEHGMSERTTRLSQAEQRTMMTLWCMFKSPLMLGCELTDMDEWTRKLVCNSKVLEIQKTGRNACQVMRTGDLIVWKSESETPGICWIALFNIVNWTDQYSVSFDALGIKEGNYHVEEIWTQEVQESVSKKLQVQINSHDVKLFKMILNM